MEGIAAGWNWGDPGKEEEKETKRRREDMGEARRKRLAGAAGSLSLGPPLQPSVSLVLHFGSFSVLYLTLLTPKGNNTLGAAVCLSWTFFFNAALPPKLIFKAAEDFLIPQSKSESLFR